MSLDFVGAAVSFRGLVREVDVGVMEGKLCVLVAEEMARVEKACAALRAMAAARAADYGAHRERGFGSAEDWLAGAAGSGCAKRFKLQWDHLDPVCAGGLTSFANEDPKCWECHARKCDEERAAGLYKKPRHVNADVDHIAPIPSQATEEVLQGAVA